MLKRFKATLALLAIAIIGVALLWNPSVAQQTQYAPYQYHGPFSSTGAGAPAPLQFLGPYFELPQVSTGAAGYIQWTAGRTYPDGNTSGGVVINASSSTSGAAIDASQSSCAPPLFSSCDIAIAVPNAGLTGTITGTFTAGEQVSQATSSAIAYALNAPTVGGTLYLSNVVSGTADATHTWTGAQSSATLATPSAAPAAPGTVIVTENAGISHLPGVAPVAYMITSSTPTVTSIVYPYQLNFSDTQKAVYVGYCSGTVGSAATDYAFLLGGAAAGCSANSSATTGMVISSPGVLRNLRVKDGTAPSGVLTGVWTVNVGGSATPITCTITGTATTCSDTTHQYVVTAGSLITVSDATGTSSAEAAPTVTVEKW